MKWTWALVASCLIVALLNEGLVGSIAEALGYGFALFGAYKLGSPKKASLRMKSRVRPSQYDKVL
ncbi:hypothetical protein JCM19236_1166 [Vibrio sp. JCM 19236]|nr:hypothetical protein JCM19236_1166 [Vibrio sp. JCM 19236]